jgi:hypothetical protein
MVNEYIINLFFIRIFNFNNFTYIWNDPQIYIKLNENFINMKNIDIFVKITKKYANMNSSLLSVIIPNYNNELTIKNTIDSILENNYKNF